jgi:hypothetical protein
MAETTIGADPMWLPQPCGVLLQDDVVAAPLTALLRKNSFTRSDSVEAMFCALVGGQWHSHL